MPTLSQVALLLLFAYAGACAQESHDHGVPEKLGSVSFPISCTPAVQAEFNRGVAMLHSFAYAPANAAFLKIAAEDPACAMAHWGIAMTYFHQLWEPPLSAKTVPIARREIETAQKLGSSSRREREYIQALSLVFKDADKVPLSTRNLDYEHAMADLASENKDDVEAQVFYALSLISNSPPTDKTHTGQKQALAILEPLDRAYPDHPGITHYIIHACDSSELAPRGLNAARKYARIAPSAPHALHMPSHIFTRLGLWGDSIDSNIAASRAAREQGDIGEELHAMDYLVYAYLQLGGYEDAHEVLERLNKMENLAPGEFKIGYAATAMPVRYAVERHQWTEATKIQPMPGSPPQVAAIAVWARALGRTRGEHSADASTELASLQVFEKQLQEEGNTYWATQVRILREEVMAWAAEAGSNSKQAEMLMRAAADEEDAIEKLPVTPGPVVPAREQLGDLLMEQHRPSQAVEAYKAALLNAPGRREATEALSEAQILAEK